MPSEKGAAHAKREVHASAASVAADNFAHESGCRASEGKRASTGANKPPSRLGRPCRHRCRPVWLNHGPLRSALGQLCSLHAPPDLQHTGAYTLYVASSGKQHCGGQLERPDEKGSSSETGEEAIGLMFYQGRGAHLWYWPAAPPASIGTESARSLPAISGRCGSRGRLLYGRCGRGGHA